MCRKFNKISGRACKPDSVPRSNRKRPARAAIIPLGHDSHRDSSSLPEGSHPRWLAPPQKERAHFHERSLIELGRLSPPIWPCTTRGFPCLRCRHRSGGLLPHLFTLAKTLRACRGRALARLLSKTSRRFPCAMPPCCAPPAVYSLWHFP